MDIEKLKAYLERIIRQIVRQETRSCFRVVKAKVITAPNSTTGVCEIQLIGNTQTLSLPYTSEVSGAEAGDMVLVGVVYNNFRNAFVWKTISSLQ